MKQQIFDETNGLWYERHGDYYFPLLSVPAEQPSDNRPISKHGRMRLRYMKEHAPHTLNALTLNGMLHDHLANIERDAQSRMNTLIRQMQAAEGITEEMKARDQMAWVGVMNSIHARAEEIVLSEIVYG